MENIEQIFNNWIQTIYRQHDELQSHEDEKLKNKEFELEGLDASAASFEENMELTAGEIEKWLIKNQLDK